MSIYEKYKIEIPDRLSENETILIIDDQQDMRMIVVHQLNKLTFANIKQTNDGLEALEAVKSRKSIAAIICSENLPQMNGIELLQELREDPDIKRPPFCLTMSAVSKEKIMFAIESGVDEILVKPFTLGDIVPKLRKAFSAFHNPKNPEKLYELAKQKLRDKEFEDAKEIYAYLISSSPQSARPHVGMARVALKEDKYDEAIDHLKNAEQANSHFVHTYAVRGDTLALKGQPDQAVLSYKKAIEMSPLNPSRYKNPCELLLDQMKYDEIIEILQIALKHKVKFPDLYHFLSQAHYYKKDYENSAKYIRKAIDLFPENTVYLNQLALSLKESGDLDEARKTYNKVIKIDPDNKQALFNKAIMLSQNDKEEDAIKILTRLVQKYPDLQKAQDKLKELHEKDKGSE